MTNPVFACQQIVDFCTLFQVCTRLYGKSRKRSSLTTVHLQYSIKCSCTVTKKSLKYFAGCRYIDIATGYGLDDRGVGVRVPVGARIFSMSRPVLGLTQPPIQWILGALSPRVKRPGREVDNSPSTSAEVKKMWIYTSTLLYAFMA
jgi:hypothetical protein